MGRFLACFTAALGALAVLGIASCGSRTGLFGPEGIGPIEGGLPDGEVDAPSDGPVPCLPGRFDLDLATAQLMFVLDRSGSMKFYLDRDVEAPPGDQRWDYLHSALASTIVPLDGELAMGAKFFPEPLTVDQETDSALACKTESGVGIAPARGNANAILSVFDTTEPRGGTPTAEALRLAAQFLVQNRGVSRTIVLATDGAPNCNGDLDPSRCTCTTPNFDCAANPDPGRYSCLDDQRTLAVIHDIADTQKVPVYVVGIGPGSRTEYRVVLDEMAVAGGRPLPGEPKDYSVETPAEMTAAFTTIRDSVAKCTYLTPSSPNDPNAITVEIDGVQVPRDQTHQNGWDWVDQAYGELAFSGAACAKAQSGTAKITGVVTCNDR